MTLTWTDLKDYVGALDDDEAHLTVCLDTATSLVAQYVGDVDEGDPYPVPEDVLASVVLEVGSKLFARRGSPNLHTMGDTLAAGGTLVAKDPLVTVYPILNRYIVAGL